MLSDEKFYETALEEFESDGADAALKAKAYVEADGAKEKIKVEYIKLRVAQLKRESAAERVSIRVNNAQSGVAGILLSSYTASTVAMLDGLRKIGVWISFLSLVAAIVVMINGNTHDDVTAWAGISGLAFVACLTIYPKKIHRWALGIVLGE